MATTNEAGAGSGRRPSRRTHDAPRSPRADKVREPGRRSAAWAMKSAAGQLEELLGRAPEAVTAVRPTEEGWEADVEVVELERVPETTSVLGTYHVSLDADGALLSYERTGRHTRGQIDQRG
ncbi:gas vesicle protein [Streptomyces sp. NPDC046985]|uniref:gas vesicle protein GvpO n=1 Tax=Streptomyces sp. NPDC046985 TaxID=3155377 RepID=UPI00340400BF